MLTCNVPTLTGCISTCIPVSHLEGLSFGSTNLYITKLLVLMNY